MPGVPSDTIAQVKKGFRGLFSRRKSKQYAISRPQVTAPSSSKTETGNVSTTPNAAIAAPVTMGAKNADIVAVSAPEQSKTIPGSSQMPQSGSIKSDRPHASIDNNMQAESTSQAVETKSPEDSPKQAESTAAANTPAPTDKDPTSASKSTPKPLVVEDENGMSATSGPLGDHHLAEEFGFAEPPEELDTSVPARGGREAIEDSRTGEEALSEQEAIPKPKVGQYGS